jgi:ribosomal protein L37AE/L43A
MKLLNWILKWILVILLVLAAGLMVIIFLSPRPELTPFLFRLVLLTAIALIGGLLIRLLFRGFPVLLNLLLSIISCLAALLSIDHFYATAYQFTFLSTDFRLKTPSLSDGAQLFIMSLITFLPLLIFRKTVKSVSSQSITTAPKKAKVTFSQAISPALVKVDPRNWTIWKKEAISPAKRKSVRPQKVKKEAVSMARPSASVSARQPLTFRAVPNKKTAKKKLKLPGGIIKGSAADVKLVGAEEHVCPYCLEEVVKADSRGVVVCHECGTWHHQDCWDLTGSCGVAHRNEL